MFTTTETEAKLDAEINSVLDVLKSKKKTDADYSTLVEQVSKLHKLKTEEKSKPISKDTLLVVAANLLGILWITAVERENVLTTKVQSFVLKPR